MTDTGAPAALDIEQATLANKTFRTTLWTAKHLQLTVMSIPPGDDIGLEVHPETDQFLRVEQGRARCQMGVTEEDLSFDQEVSDGWAVLVPAGTWHNITNIGDDDVRVYVLYGPPDHQAGTVHETHQAALLDPNED